jgi:GTP cyclohydrolase I
MDQRLFRSLLKKRGRVGLSDAEADELGRLFAEQEGKPYSNAALLRREQRSDQSSR